MMDFLYDLCGKPFGWIMRLIYDWVDNYAFAILLFTIFTKLILFPISYKQQKNSARMQRVNPKMEKLRQKYKDDPKKMQDEALPGREREPRRILSADVPAVLHPVRHSGRCL